MSRQDLAEDYIRFLINKGSISHIVKAPPSSSISTLALTQRCLASGIEFPVPMPDGSVAINISGDVPKALAALDLVIEPVHPNDLDEGDFDRTPGEFEDVVAERGTDTEDSKDDENVDDGDIIQDVNQGENPSAERMLGDTHEPSDLPGMGAFEEIPGEATDEGEDGPAVFVRSGEQDSVDEGEDVSSEITDSVEDIPDDAEADTLGVDAAESEQCFEEAVIESAQPIEDAPSDMPAFQSDDVSDDDVSSQAEAINEGVERILSKLSAFEARFAALEDGQSGVVGLIDSFGETLDEVASRKIPRPDTSEFNRGVARISTALTQTLRRTDDALNQLATGPKEGGSEVAASLSRGLSALADAVRATQDPRTSASPELAMISSMQETLSHQLAKLLEADHSNGVPAVEEFLLDVRHATAELLAEQARAAKASQMRECRGGIVRLFTNS